jgi:hypothetical protein
MTINHSPDEAEEFLTPRTVVPNSGRKSSVDLSLLYRLHKDREDALNEERSLTLRMFARLRRIASQDCPEHQFKCKRCDALAKQWMSGKGDPVAAGTAMEFNAPLLQAQIPCTAWKKASEKEMISLAKEMPVAPFVERTRGFGYLGLAQIVAEAGDLSNYTNPGKLWKRFGLAVFDGKAQRRSTNKEMAITMGFSPRRRSLMFVIGDSLIKATGGEYRVLYLERKAYEVEQHPEARPMQHHRRAQRYMEKRLLRELWKEWRAQ